MNLLGGPQLSVEGEDGHAALFAQRHYQCDNAACRYAVGETLVLVRHDDAFAYLVQIRGFGCAIGNSFSGTYSLTGNSTDIHLHVLGLLCSVDGYYHQRVCLWTECYQSALLAGVDKLISLGNETAELLSHIIVLHLVKLLCASVEIAFYQTPLVVVVLYVLPVEPSSRAEQSDIMDKLLGQLEVAIQPLTACTHLTHPQVFLLFATELGELYASLIVGLIGVCVPLSHQGQYASLLVSLESLYRGHYAGLIGC